MFQPRKHCLIIEHPMPHSWARVSNSETIFLFKKNMNSYFLFNLVKNIVSTSCLYARGTYSVFFIRMKTFNSY